MIAEGVETEEEWKFLHKQNCDGIQGFFISKPVSSKDVWMLLHKNNRLSKTVVLELKRYFIS